MLFKQRIPLPVSESLNPDRITKLTLTFLRQVRVNKEQDHVLISPQGLSYAEVTGTTLVSEPVCCRGNTGKS